MKYRMDSELGTSEFKTECLTVLRTIPKPLTGLQYIVRFWPHSGGYFELNPKNNNSEWEDFAMALLKTGNSDHSIRSCKEKRIERETLQWSI